MMDLGTFERLIANSDYEDWTFISCGGAGSGASFLESITTWTNGRGELSGIEVDSHYQVMSFKGDLLISAAHGMQHLDDFREDWLAPFADKSASSGFVDFFYSRSLVFRDIYVSVDGGRCLLPLPKQTFDDNGNVTSLTVTEQRVRFFSVLNGSGSASDVYGYLRRAGIEVVEGYWMTAPESY